MWGDAAVNSHSLRVLQYVSDATINYKINFDDNLNHCLNERKLRKEFIILENFIKGL